MTFCLDTKIIKPENDIAIKNAVILLHGYGGDGNDISMLTLNWKRFLPNTIFLCPDGHERCLINPSGYQWFDLTKDDPSYILEESKKAEIRLKQFIEEVRPLLLPHHPFKNFQLQLDPSPSQIPQSSSTKGPPQNPKQSISTIQLPEQS